MSKQYRKTFLEINLENIYKNFELIQKKVNPKKVIPVVKANAYGHGLKMVTQYLIEKGVNYFAVAIIEEAMEIRKISKDVNILVMGVVTSEDFDDLSEHNITFTLHNESLFNEILNYNKSLRCHLKIDTGMNRLGFKDIEKAIHVLSVAKKMKSLHIEGVYSHLATSDSNHDFTLKQVSRFKDFIDQIPKKNLPSMIHISNSSGALKHENSIKFTTHARVGVSLYGETLEEDVDYLYSTFVLKSKISEIKTLYKGDKLGYDITYEAKNNERIAILPIGYADGVYRNYQGGCVLISSCIYQIIGRVCMDQLFIKIGDNVHKNDIVVLLGEGETSIKNVAIRLKTIPHEVLCSVSSRVPRFYKK